MDLLAFTFEIKCLYKVNMLKDFHLLKLMFNVKERENSYQKLKRSPEERHTHTHGNLIKIFCHRCLSQSKENQNVCEHTTKMASQESF